MRRWRRWQGRRRVQAGGLREEDNAASVDSNAAELGFYPRIQAKVSDELLNKSDSF